jgi:hypothetical protein
MFSLRGIKSRLAVPCERYRARPQAKATSLRRNPLKTDKMPENQLDCLQTMSKVVADTGACPVTRGTAPVLRTALQIGMRRV